MGDNIDACWASTIDQNSTIGARRLPAKGAIRLCRGFASPQWYIKIFANVDILAI